MKDNGGRFERGDKKKWRWRRKKVEMVGGGQASTRQTPRSLFIVKYVFVL